MRIISGTARGRKLIAPAGEVTRPTADQVKESMFNIIQFDIEDREVLDAFCGSGQLGLEALSRGAVSAVMIDMSSDAVTAARANAETLGFADRCRVIAGEALQYIATTREKFDLIFLDPPYHTALLDKALLKIAEFDILRAGGIILCECARDESPTELSFPYEKGKTYRYGAKNVVIYVRRSDTE